MSEEVENLLCLREVYSSRILAITFTNKAAREMKEQIFSLVGRMQPISDQHLHSTCVRILEGNKNRLYPQFCNI